METTMDQTTTTAQAATILARSVCLTLTCHYLGNYRKVTTTEVVTDAGGDIPTERASQLNTSMRLVDSKELTAAMRVIGKAKAFLRSRAIPAHRVFGDRTYLVPIALVQAVDEELRSLADELGVEAFLLAERYDAARAKQIERVGPLAERSAYPTAERVRQAFGLDWTYVSFAAPERLETVDRALYEHAQAKYEAQLGDAYREVELVLRDTLRQIVAEVARKLEPGSDLKPKAIRGTMLKDLADYVATFRARDLTGDAELGAIVNELRGLADSDPVAYKDNASLRAHALSIAQVAVSKLDALVEVTRGRGISFGPVEVD